MLTPLIADFPLLLVWVALMLHVIGERQAVRLRGRPRNRQERTRGWYFYGGLLTIVISLAGPIDSYATKLFWVHMIQHVLLLTVAAPLIVMGAPWMSVWRPLPLGFRRSVAKTMARARWTAPLRAVGRALGRPYGAWIAFSVNLVVWHIPVFYDLTLRHILIHAFEHTTFLLFGILLWSQVLSSPPLRVRLRSDHRVYYILASVVPGWILSLILAFASAPLYPVYAHIADRPGGISALTDQRIAGGMMLVPGSLTATLYVFIGLYVWLGQDEDTRRRREPPRDSAAGSLPS